MPRTPNTIIQFFNIPWDSGYRNLRWWGSESARDAWFANRDHVTLPSNDFELEVSHMQPVKEGIPYTVASNWDNMRRYNYMRYINSAYPQGKWHYCFIDGWTYASEHSCTMSFHRDAWTDNIGHLSFSDCFIERETTDTVTTLPEPVSINKYNRGAEVSLTENVNTLCYMFFYSQYLDDGTVVECTIDGKKYPLGLVATTDYNRIKDIVQIMSQLGKSQNIIGVIACSEDYVNIRTTDNVNFKERVFTVSRSVGSYTPRNSKCYRYPYCYLEVYDKLGGSQIVKWEDGDDGTITFSLLGGLGLSCFATLQPRKNAIDHMFNQCISHQISFTFGFTADGVSQWLAQNSGQMQASKDIQSINVGASAISGLAGVIGGIASGAAVGGAVGAVAGGVLGAGGTAMNIAQNIATFDISQNAQMAQSAFSANSTQVPSGSGQGLICNGLEQFYCCPVYPSPSEFKALDDYFTRFGYAVNRIGNPTDRVSGKNYYFVKTSGCTIRGASPQDDRNALMSAFDRGITIWTVDSIGNY